jgi:hypothetical protein
VITIHCCVTSPRTRKTQLSLLLRNLATDCLPRICLRGNLFTNTLPSNWCTCNNMYLSSHICISSYTTIHHTQYINHLINISPHTTNIYAISSINIFDNGRDCNADRNVGTSQLPAGLSTTVLKTMTSTRWRENQAIQASSGFVLLRMKMIYNNL